MLFGLGLLALLCILWTPPALLLYPLLSPKTGQRVGRAVISFSFRFYLASLSLLCAFRFDLRELNQLAREKRPCVVVANHPSLLDAVILISQLPNAVCVMKALLARNLLLGAGARLARYIVNDPPLSMLRHAVRELQDGATLIIFPEGTRTDTPPVGACSATAAVLAARSGVPMQTLLIEMSSLYLGKHWPLWRPPALPLTVRVRRGECWQFDGPENAAREFGPRIEAFFRSALAPDLTLGPSPAATAGAAPKTAVPQPESEERS